MAEVETDRLLPIVVGIRLHAELGDRPLAYCVEKEARRILADLRGGDVGSDTDAQPPSNPARPALAPVVVSDVLYLNSDALRSRPTISIGGPGVNALSANLVDELPTALAIEDAWSSRWTWTCRTPAAPSGA